MTSDALIAKAIEAAIAGSEATVYVYEGFAYVEVVCPAFSDDDPTKDQQEVIKAILAAGQNVIVDALRLYRDGALRFTERASLHTVKSGYGPEGVWTSTLAADDAFVMVAEIDAEFLINYRNLAQTPAGFQCRAVNELDPRSGNPVLPLKANIDYRELEMLGFNISVLKSSFDGTMVKMSLGDWVTGSPWNPITSGSL